MDIALVSVLSSGLVALASIAAGFFTARGQRKHEQALGYQERVWEQKSQALFTVIEVCRDFMDLSSGGDTDPTAMHAARARKRLDEVVPAVEAFASTSCRVEFGALRTALAGAAATEATEKIDQIRADRRRLIRTNRLDQLPDLRTAEQALLDGVQDVDARKVADICAQAKVVIGESRQCLRGKD